MNQTYYFLGKELPYPVGNGAGVCKTLEDLKMLLQTDIGFITIGSITKAERFGNEGDTFYHCSDFTLNSLGLPNPGKAYYEKNLSHMIELIHKAGKIAIVSVVGFTAEEYAELTSFAFECGADFVEENYGCPNVLVNGKQKSIISYDLSSLKEITKKVISAAKGKKIGIKLSPIINPAALVDIATYLNEIIPKVSFVTTMNTVPNCYEEVDDGSVITPNFGFAGMAGSAILPIALGQVKKLRELLNPSIEIIGAGGISSGEHVKKFLKSGANLTQVVSHYYKNPNPMTFQDIITGLID